MRGLRGALRFLTRIPVPGPATRAEDLPAALLWFPLLGAGIGALIAAAYLQLAALWPPPVAAVLAVAFGLLLTGALHEDAVADSADGLGGGFDRTSVLEILRDSRVGSYGVCALWGGYLHRRLGGQSGDLLGAGNQLVEAGVLLVCLVGTGA